MERSTTASSDGSRLRRAVVLPIPEPVASLVDAIRARWDPVMKARIGAHLTIVHDVVDHGVADDLIAATAAAIEPFDVTLTTTGCWGARANFGVYLDVDDPTGGVADLHLRLAPLEAPAWSRVPFRPHITLVHGRTVAPDAAEPAWAALRHLQACWTVELCAVDVLELDEPTGWRSVARVPLTAPAVSG